MNFTEDEMAQVIVDHSSELLGEDLTLVARKHWIGRYELDLLFKDRHGAHLIVELQRGALDRYHLYKVLDYYDEYKSRNVDTFVEVMVVANLITAERKERLSRRGVSFKEIPVSIIEEHLATAKGTAAMQSTAAAETGQPSPGDVGVAVHPLPSTIQAALLEYENTVRPLMGEEAATLMRAHLEVRLREFNDWSDDTLAPFGVAWVQCHADYAPNFAGTPMARDREVLTLADSCELHHLELLFRPGAQSLVALCETLANEIFTTLPREFGTVLMWGHDAHNESLRKERRIAMQALLTKCTADPSVLRDCCKTLATWTELLRNVISSPGGLRTPTGADFAITFVFISELLATICAELLWRTSVARFRTRAIAVGINRRGELESRTCQLPSDSNTLIPFFLALAYAWACPPAIQRLWQNDDVLSVSAADEIPTAPHVEDPYSIVADLLPSAYHVKAYAVSEPAEVLIGAGDIKSVTLLESGTRELVYRVRYRDNTVAFGFVCVVEVPDGHCNVQHLSTQTFAHAIRGGRANQSVVQAHEAGCELALVSAIARDFFVCEERERFYQPSRKALSKGTRHKPHDVVVRYLPRIRIRYIGIREREFQDAKLTVVPHSVVGHLRRVRFTGSRQQLELARDYSVVVPEGFTFVRPHERGTAERIVYRSRSALQLIYGGRRPEP